MKKCQKACITQQYIIYSYFICFTLESRHFYSTRTAIMVIVLMLIAHLGHIRCCTCIFFFIKSLHKIKIGAKIIPISQKKKLSLAKITELARGRQRSYPQNSMTWSLMGILIAWNSHSLNARCPNLIPLKLHFLPIFSLYFQSH